MTAAVMFLLMFPALLGEIAKMRQLAIGLQRSARLKCSGLESDKKKQQVASRS
jgi:hypothetical protein